jgi:hypothetical protein
MKKYLLSLMLLGVTFGLMAQQRTIKGVVSDGRDPIPGAAVRVEGTSRGATADFDGEYEIAVSSGETLMFSAV